MTIKFEGKIIHINKCYNFQRLPPERGGTAQSNIFHPGNRSQLNPSRTVVKSLWSQSCEATLTHYSTETQTTRPDYDPLLLLLAIAGDVHPNPGQPRFQRSQPTRGGTVWQLQMPANRDQLLS